MSLLSLPRTYPLLFLRHPQASSFCLVCLHSCWALFKGLITPLTGGMNICSETFSLSLSLCLLHVSICRVFAFVPVRKSRMKKKCCLSYQQVLLDDSWFNTFIYVLPSVFLCLGLRAKISKYKKKYKSQCINLPACSSILPITQHFLIKQNFDMWYSASVLSVQNTTAATFQQVQVLSYLTNIKL